MYLFNSGTSTNTGVMRLIFSLHSLFPGKLKAYIHFPGRKINRVTNWAFGYGSVPYLNQFSEDPKGFGYNPKGFGSLAGFG